MKSPTSITFTLLILGMFALVLAGCGNFNATVPAVTPHVALHGIVHGGQQPVVGSSIQLYAAGNTGYGSAFPYASGTSLLGTHVVQTDAAGGWVITGDYTCPSATTEVYLVATGGLSAGPSNPANPSIALMAALGPCGLLNSSTYITINEITTVASVWAVSPFMTGITHIGTSAGNAQGLTNAFATVNKLANIAAGSVYGPALPFDASTPVAKINTLADILAACVNSAGDTGPDSACDVLFTAATVNGIKPADTLTAAMNLAQHPNQGTSLIGLVVPTSPFQPSLASPPSDFSLVITYSKGGLSVPDGIATDASGNVWVANAGNNSVTKLDALGITPTDATGFLSGAMGFKVSSLIAPAALAIDQSGNAWVANANNTVTQLSSDGSTGTLFSGGGLSTPTSVAIDASSNVWIANCGGPSVTKITPGPTPIYANYPYTGVGSFAPTSIAIDPK